jgi:uncharacterized protein (DUF1330 family)
MTEIALDPLPEQVTAFLANHPEGEPVFMLNLLKFKTRATYHDGEEISGAKAYARYGEAFGKMVAEQKIDGAHSVFGGKIGSWLIGQGEGEWDAVAIFRYPDAKTMFATVSSEAYRKIHKHRKAGLEGQLLIACSGSDIF